MGKKGRDVVSLNALVEAKRPTPGPSARKADIKCYQLSTLFYIKDSKYTFSVFHAHGAKWEERLTKPGYEETSFGRETRGVLETAHKSSKVPMVHCECHRKGNSEVVQAGSLAAAATGRAARSREISQHSDNLLASLSVRPNLPPCGDRGGSKTGLRMGPDNQMTKSSGKVQGPKQTSWGLLKSAHDLGAPGGLRRLSIRLRLRLRSHGSRVPAPRRTLG